MAIWAVTGGGGAPGVTTIAMALARTLQLSDRRSVLVDLDPDGGTAALRAGVSADPGVFLLLDPVRGVAPQSAEIADITRQTPDGWGLVPGFLHSGQAHQVSRVAGTDLLRAVAQQYDDVVVDVGRYRPGLSGWVITAADHTLWIVDPSPEGVIRLAAAFGGVMSDEAGEGYVVINHSTRREAVADVGIGIEQMWGLKVVSFCPHLTRTPQDSAEMRFACAQAITVLAPGVAVAEPSRAEKRWWR